MQGWTRPVSSGPFDAYSGSNWSCVGLVLTPGTQRGNGPQPSSPPVAPKPRAPCQGAAIGEIVDYRRICRYGSGDGEGIADVSGTLVCDERADTQESDPTVDRALLVLAGSSVGDAGDAGARPGRS